MELKNATLAALLTILLITRPVECAGGKTPTSLAPSTLHVRDPVAPSHKECLPGPSTEQTTSLVSTIDPIASSPEWITFREAVQSGDVEVAFGVFRDGSDALKKYCGKRLASLKSSTLVRLISSASFHYVPWLLSVILVHANQTLMDKVFAELKPSNDLLSWVATGVNVACMPQKFTYLLKKIDDKNAQELAVRYGVLALLDKSKDKCLEPLLSELSEGVFLSNNLENVASSTIFSRASNYQYNRILLAKRFVDHPAISANNYSFALHNFYDNGGKAKQFFYWFLSRADRDDLYAVKKSYDLSGQNIGFQKIVNRILQAVNPEAMPGIPYPRGVVLIKETLEKNVPMALIAIISEYYYGHDSEFQQAVNQAWQIVSSGTRQASNPDRAALMKHILGGVILNDLLAIIGEYIK